MQYLSYEGTQGATAGPARGQISRDIGFAEGTEPAGQSLQLGGTGVAYESFAWQAAQASTFGAVNAGQTLQVPGQATASLTFGGTAGSASDKPGYRQLAAPLAGIRVADLAARNLVQGVPGAGPFPGQYSDAGTNLFISYNDPNTPNPNGTTANTYRGADNTAQALGLGRGFFWYLFDADIDPDPNSFGGGTSTSVALPQTVSFTGIPAAPTGAAGPDLTVAFTVNAFESYLIGNPVNGPFALSGVSLLTSTGTTTTPATINTNFQTFDPAIDNYTVIPQTASLATGQGVWVDVSGIAAGTTVRTFGLDFDPTGAGATFYGRAAASRVALALDGQVATDAGTVAVHDRAAILDFAAEASAAWDAGDATKLTPPTDAYALVAIVGTREGPSAGRPSARCRPAPRPSTSPSRRPPPARSSFPRPRCPRLERRAHGPRRQPHGRPHDGRLRVCGRGRRLDVALRARGHVWQRDGGRGGGCGLRARVGLPNPAAGRAALELRVGRGAGGARDGRGRARADGRDGVRGHALGGPVADAGRRDVGLAPGVYVVRVQGATFAETRRLVVSR